MLIVSRVMMPLLALLYAKASAWFAATLSVGETLAPAARDVLSRRSLFSKIVIILIIALAAGGVSYQAIRSIGDDFVVYEDAARDALIASEINADKAKVLLNAREYLVTRGADDLNDTRRFLSAAKAGIYAAIFHLRDSGDSVLAGMISVALDAFERGLERLIELLAERDRIVAQELDVSGPKIREQLAKVIRTAPDYETVGLAGQIQEDLMTARLYITKFLVSNTDDDAKRADAEFQQLAGKMATLSARLTAANLQNQTVGLTVRSAQSLIARYQAAFGALKTVIAERNRVRAETLDDIGTNISLWASGIKNRAVTSERIISDRLLRSINNYTLIIPFGVALAFGLPGIAWLFQTQRLHGNQRTLSLRNMQFEVALKHMNQGMCMFDANARLVVANGLFATLYDLPPDQIRPGMPLREILELRVAAGTHYGAPEDYISDRIATFEQNLPKESLLSLHNGRTMLIKFQPLKEGGWVSTHEDVTEQKLAEARTQHMARHDALTGLANRGAFKEFVEETLVGISEERSLAVMLLDLDRFKQVNDTLGHAIGDQVLREVTQRFKSLLPAGDLLARLGGDEFVIAHRQSCTSNSHIELVEAMIETVNVPFKLDHQDVNIGLSVGIAIAPHHGEDYSDLLKCADMALYRSKEAGRNTHTVFEQDMSAQVRHRQKLEADLRRALERGEISLQFQPILDLESNTISACEALLRWSHPERGLIPPFEFIRIAESIGVMEQIGEWVLRQACEIAARWPENIRLCLNVSTPELRRPDFAQHVLRALADSSLPARRLEIEITEPTLMQECGSRLATLRKLRGYGVGISLDDFGSDFSNLSYLRRFPFSRIKIDPSFIHDVSDRFEALATIRAIVGLTHDLGMRTVAEGVETPEELAHLRRLGCTEAQGFLIKAPCDIVEINKLLGANLGAQAVA